MNERQEDIEEFINGIKEDIMEIYKVSDDEAISLLNNFKIRELINKHRSIAAHYSPEEYAHTAYEHSNKLNKK